MAELTEKYQAVPESKSDPGRAFDRQMAAYLWELRQQDMSRRGFLRLAAGSLAAAAMGATYGGPTEAAGKAFLPGLSVVQVEGGTFTFGLEGDVRGLEPALSYDFTANPVVCQISEGLLMFDA